MKRRTFLQAALATVALAASAATLAARAAAEMCTKVVHRPRALILPPLPKWNKATDDIDCADFLSRSLDFERSLLPADLVFPREGQIWEAVCDCEAPVLERMAFFKNPLFRQTAKLCKGERVRILALEHPKPMKVRFRLLRSAASHQRTAPASLPCELCLRTARIVPISGHHTGCFSELFRLIEDAA